MVSGTQTTYTHKATHCLVHNHCVWQKCAFQNNWVMGCARSQVIPVELTPSIYPHLFSALRQSPWLLVKLKNTHYSNPIIPLHLSSGIIHIGVLVPHTVWLLSGERTELGQSMGYLIKNSGASSLAILCLDVVLAPTEIVNYFLGTTLLHG